LGTQYLLEKESLNNKIRVLIADDHRLMVEGLKLILSRDGIEVVGHAATGRQTVDLTTELHPDVILMDIRMPDMDGLQALGAVKASNPETSVIILTSYNNPEYLTRAISLGAAGYLMKDTAPDSVTNAVRTVAGGEAILDMDILDQVINELSESTRPVSMKDDIPALTPQEVRILQLITEGLDNGTIAEILSVSTNTIKSHIRNIFTKLGVSDRTQAAIWAIRRGLTA
jgi:DNA-binding NarL/FixJ family response regulator